MENKELTFKRNSTVSDILSESGCDYSLPDYKTDVRKLLFTEAQLVPSSSFLDSGEISGSGIVNYSVIYLDTENKMCGATFSSDYDFTVRCHDGCDAFYVDSHLGAFSVRLVGPRKFSAKSTVISTADMLVCEAIEEKGDAFFEGAERNEIKVSLAKRQRFSLKERTLAEKLAELDGVIVDDVRVIYSTSRIDIQSVKQEEGGIDVKGAVEVVCLCEADGASPETYRCSMPFDERIETDGVSGGAYLYADGTVSSLRVTVNPSEFGCNITADVIAELFVTATDKNELLITSDAYSKKGETEAEYSELFYESYISSVSDKAAIEVSKPREELGLSDARNIVFLDGKIKIDSANVNGGEINLDGEIRFCGIAAEPMPDGEMSYVNFKYTHPFYRNVKLRESTVGDAVAYTHARIGDARALFDRDFVELSAEVSLDISYGERRKEVYVSSLRFSEEVCVPRKKSEITVYYPSPDDTLFGIAKKFRTTVRDIAVNNSLSESVVSSGSCGGISAKKLIIR